MLMISLADDDSFRRDVFWRALMPLISLVELLYLSIYVTSSISVEMLSKFLFIILKFNIILFILLQCNIRVSSHPL